MSCTRGCCETQAEHYRSLLYASPDRRALRKVTTHRDSRMSVDVTERWDGQDVTVKPGPVKIKADELGPNVAGALRDQAAERTAKLKESRRGAK